MGFRWFRVSGLKVYVLGFGVSGFRVEGLGVEEVKGLWSWGFRLQGFRDQG